MAADEAYPTWPGGEEPPRSVVVSPLAGLRGAVAAGGLSLVLIGGLWLASRGAPSAASDPSLVPPSTVPAATPGPGERFGLDLFPTARAVIRRPPAAVATAGMATRTVGGEGRGGGGRESDAVTDAGTR